jgi:hypothetical protein
LGQERFPQFLQAGVIGDIGNNFFRLANAKIAELWFISDNMGLMQQLGALPAPSTP